MKKILLLILTLIILNSCTGRSGSLSYKDYLKRLDNFENEDFRVLKKDILEKSPGFEALEKITSTLSHRLAGSENGKKAEEFIYSSLKSLGLEAEYSPFSMNLWRRKHALLSINTPESVETMDTVSFAYTPEFSDVKADIIDLGNGLAEDFTRQKGRIKGRIALINLTLLGQRYDSNRELKGNPHRSVKARMAFDRGALGIIFVNGHYGMVLSTGTVSTNNDHPLQIPALCVSWEEGRKIRSYLEKGLYTGGHILVESSYEKAEARNVIGRIRGLEKPEERVVIGGHLDSWDLGQGAIDNGIGAFSLLDIARAYKSGYINPRRTVEFIFWMGEEHGLLGSKHFIKTEIEKGTIGSIRYYLNVDMQGNPRGFDVEGRESMRDIVTSVGAKAVKLGLDFENMNRSKPTMGPYSDDLNFSVQGIPVLQQISGLDPAVYKYYHSTRDNFSLVNEDHMKRSSLFMGMALYRVAGMRVLPAKVLSIDETRSFFTEHGGTKLLSPEYNWDARIKAGESSGLAVSGGGSRKKTGVSGEGSN